MMWQWKIIYKSAGPVIVYLDAKELVVGYDFYNVTTRTGIMTRFFNIELREIRKEVFDFPKVE